MLESEVVREVCKESYMSNEYLFDARDIQTDGHGSPSSGSGGG
jgi:hypothetical protein